MAIQAGITSSLLTLMAISRPYSHLGESGGDCPNESAFLRCSSGRSFRNSSLFPSRSTRHASTPVQEGIEYERVCHVHCEPMNETRNSTLKGRPSMSPEVGFLHTAVGWRVPVS